MNYSGYASIHARHIPDKVCLIERTPASGERRTFTWKEFNDEINRTANYLVKELKVAPWLYAPIRKDREPSAGSTMG